MTEPIVLDTNVFIVSLLSPEVLDSEETQQRPLATNCINGVQNGSFSAHLPTIAIVKIIGVTRRTTKSETIAAVVKNRLAQWVTLGQIKLYHLDQRRMALATDLILKHNRSVRKSLPAPDATFIPLAEELEVPVVSFGEYFEEVSDRAVVPS